MITETSSPVSWYTSEDQSQKPLLKESQFNAHFTNIVREHGTSYSIDHSCLPLPGFQASDSVASSVADLSADWGANSVANLGLVSTRQRETANDPLGVLKAIVDRQKKRVEDKFNPLTFVSNSTLIPMKLKNGLFQVLESKPGVYSRTLEWKYTFVYHGTRTHEWSLLRAQNGDTDEPVCPLAVLNTWSSDAKTNECKVVDLIDPVQPSQFKLAHFWDSYANNGTHIGFQLNDTYRYEWKHANAIYNTEDLYLWRIPLADEDNLADNLADNLVDNLVDNPVVPVARIKPESSFLNPVDGCRMWCLETDGSYIDQHLALVSAFYLKVSHVKQHAFFASKTTHLEPKSQLQDIGFEHNRHLYKNVLGMWEEYPNSSKSAQMLKIKVFGGRFFSQYKLVPGLVNALELEMKAQSMLQ